MNQKINLLIVTAALGSSILAGSAHAQGTAFTYQGWLQSDANAANGNYDLRFALYDAVSTGNQQGPFITNSAVAVSNGLFAVSLDFSNQFPGAARWLEIAVRTNGSGSFFTLAPRQPLTPAPYAITAGNVTSGGLSAGTYGSAVVFSNAGNNFAGVFSGNGGSVSNVNALALGGLAASNFWQTGGNSGTSPASNNYLGTADNQPLEFRANNQRALRLEPGIPGAPNVIGGSAANAIAAGTAGATISGGSGNLIQSTAPYSAIPGGTSAVARSYGQFAFASGNTAVSGDAQTSIYVVRGASPYPFGPLYLDGGSSPIFIPNNSTWTFHILLVGRYSTGKSASYELTGGVENNAGTASWVGGTAPTFTTVANELGGVMFPNPPTVALQSPPPALYLLAPGPMPPYSGTINWVAVIQTAEVIH